MNHPLLSPHSSSSSSSSPYTQTYTQTQTQTMLDDPLSFFSRAAVQTSNSSGSTNRSTTSSSSSSSSSSTSSSSTSGSSGSSNGETLSSSYSGQRLPSAFPPSSSPWRQTSGHSLSMVDDVHRSFESSSSSAPPAITYRSYAQPPMFAPKPYRAADTTHTQQALLAVVERGQQSREIDPLQATPHHPLSQRVSITESPLQSGPQSSFHLQVQDARVAAVNSSPDFSSMSSSPAQNDGRRRRFLSPRAALSPVPPAPMSLPVIPPLESVSSLSRGSYGSFSAPNCPKLVTRLMIPILLFLSILVCITYGMENNACQPDVDISHGWCCLKNSFTRYLSLTTYIIHTIMLTWLLQLYHTPYLSCFPQRRSFIMVAFFLRATFLIFVWMLYFLILSLNLISTLPEQVHCTTTLADRTLFFPAAILNITCCLFVKVMLGLMGKSIWKYWELRHLTPQELLAYEQQLEEGRHYGLNKEQMDVLLKVILTCDHKTSNAEDCPVCGAQGYRQPSIVAAVREVVKPVVSRVNRHRQQHLLSLDNYEDENPSGPISMPPASDSSDNSSGSGGVPVPVAPSLSAPSGLPRSQASLVDLGGLPAMTCGICLEDYLVHDRVLILPCRHHFHLQCCTGWLNGHRTCPTCRAKVVKEPERSRGDRGHF